MSHLLDIQTSAYEPCGLSGRHLSPVSVAWSDLEYFCFPLDEMLVHRRVTPSIKFGSAQKVREALWELRILPKHTTQCPRQLPPTLKRGIFHYKQGGGFFTKCKMKNLFLSSHILLPSIAIILRQETIFSWLRKVSSVLTPTVAAHTV